MVPTQSSPVTAAAEHVSAIENSPQHSPLILEILHGRTRFRQRPVTGTRFTIGSGAACDLRLGGADMPPLHSLITVAGDEIELEAIAPEPAVLVNGRVASTYHLQNGDVIRIGTVEMLARIGPAGRRPAAESAALAHAGWMTPEIERNPADLSAAELVEQIEKEQALVDQFEGKQQLGADSLVQALIGRLAEFEEKRRLGADILAQALVNRRSRGSRRVLQTGSAAPIPAPHFHLKPPRRTAEIMAGGTSESAQPHSADAVFVHDLEQLGQSLSELSQELQRTALRASEREASYASATTLLLDAQQKLASQFEVLLSQVESLREQQSPTRLRQRAIA